MLPGKVVVTGLGIVAPSGIGVDAYWDSLLSCRSGIGPITRFDCSDHPVKVAGEVSGFNMRDYFGSGVRPHRYSRQTQMGLVACQEALCQAGLTSSDLQRLGDVPVFVGISSSATHVVEESIAVSKKRGPANVPLTVRAYPPAATAGAITEIFDFAASCTTISCCCPSGLDAVMEGARLIRSGAADLVIAGAADSYVSAITVAAFAAIGLNSRSDAYPPHEISRPFDRNRTGAVFSEGAGFLVLERLEHALARGAQPRMEILSGARFTDKPGEPELSGMGRSMRQALRNSGLLPDAVAYICADAASQLSLDVAESRMINQVFGARTMRIPVSSVRGVTGHALAAAAMMQLVAIERIFHTGKIFPTAHLTDPDPACALQHVQYHPLEAQVDVAMVNSRGMAKENSSLVVRRI